MQSLYLLHPAHFTTTCISEFNPPVNEIIMTEKPITSINPATGESLGYFPADTIEELRIRIDKARSVQRHWKETPLPQRIKHIRRIAGYLYQHADDIADKISKDNGKTQMEAFASEVFPCIMAVHYNCRKAKKFLKAKKIRASNIFFIYKRSKIVRVPWGVTGIIAPWNYPLSIPFFEIIIALLAGNAVILKTASETQLVGKTLEEIIGAAGLPDGLFTHLNLPGIIIGDALLEYGVDKLFFTGSVEVGKKLMAKASETLTPLSLELGGNDAMIVCEDANLYRAAAGVLWAGFQNCGQSCGGIERIYIHETVYDKFLSILKNGVESLRPGSGTDFNTDLAVMTTSKQLETVKHHVADAISKGAKIYAQSPLPDDNGLNNFHPAMVLADVNHSMILMSEETFGPVVGVMKFSTIEEAIALANQSILGLTASVWSKNRKNAEKIGLQIQAGVISFNDHLMSHGMPETPWGGFKESGIGRCHGELGFEEMTQPQVIIHDLLSFTQKHLWWHPYNKEVYQGIKGIMRVLYASTFFQRISGLWNFLKIVPRMFSIDPGLKGK